jgi:ABC-type bacteriocin/lantibiotic exporter with double-glycine peptidase domain
MKQDISKIKQTFRLQQSQSSCGLACIASVARLYGKNVNEEQLKINSGTTIEGTSVLGLRDAARSINFISDGYEGGIEDLKKLDCQAILHTINESIFTHFIVYYGYDRKSCKFIIGDPAKGVCLYSEEELSSIWKSKILLTIKPDSSFRQIRKTYTKERRVLLQKLISPDVHYLLTTFLLSIITSLIGFSTAIFSQKLIDNVLPAKKIEMLAYYILLYLIVIIIGIVLSYSRDILIIRQTKEFNSRLVSTFLIKLFSLPMCFFNSMKVGEIIARMKETERIQGAIISLINSTLVEFMTLFFAIVLLSFYNIKISLVTALLIPIMIVITKYFSVKIKKRQKELMINYANFEIHSIDNISGIKCIKNYIKENFFRKRLQSQYITAQETAKNLGFTHSKYDMIINILAVIFSTIAIFIGSYYVILGTLKIGELFAIITILSLTIGTSVNIISAIIHIQESVVAFERLHDILSADNELKVIPNGNNSIICKTTNGIHKLELRNVSFNYPGKDNLLENINMEINTGELVTLFGDIGTGKSTLLYLIQRFYPINKGNIYFDGININNYLIDEWRSHLSVVSQYTKLFIGSVADNITMFQEERLDDLKQFCIEMKLNCFLEPGSMHLFNIINENGINLSGGQRQLIGFARALFNDSKIIILDEPTSSMDKTTEILMIQILEKIKTKKIIIMITHKPEIARRSDKIFVLEDKQILIQGTHGELMQQKNTYSKYYSMLTN